MLAPDAGVITILFQGDKELVQIAVEGPDKLLGKMSADLARFLDSIQGIQGEQPANSPTADNIP